MEPFVGRAHGFQYVEQFGPPFTADNEEWTYRSSSADAQDGRIHLAFFNTFVSEVRLGDTLFLRSRQVSRMRRAYPNGGA